MKNTIERSGAIAVKHMGNFNEKNVAELVAISKFLNQSGVATAPIDLGEKQCTLVMPWIEGETFKARLKQRMPWQLQRFQNDHSHELISIAGSLATFQDSVPSSRFLQNYDPFAKIDRRIDAGWFKRVPIEVARQIRSLRSKLASIDFTHERPRLCHGDFHAGQLVQAYGTGIWWIIDIEDVAFGEPEVDVANFCAHLVTTPKLFESPHVEHFWTVARIMRIATPGRHDQKRLAAYGAATVLRRALKSMEQTNNTGQHAATMLLIGHALADTALAAEGRGD